jgi:hypothetical protein
MLLPKNQLYKNIGKLQLTRQNLSRVLNFRSGHVHVATFLVLSAKLPNLQLKTWLLTTSRFSPVSYHAPWQKL